MLKYHGTTFNTDHVSLGVSFVDFLRSHKKAEKIVSLLYLISECFLISNLNHPQQCQCKHDFDFSLDETTHLYTTLSTQQFPFIDHFFVSPQLHGAIGLFVLVTHSLCLLII